MIGLERNISHGDLLKFSDAIASTKSVKELVKCTASHANYQFGMYHHFPAVGAYNYHRLNRFWSIGIPDDILNYIKERGDSPDPAMRYIFSKARPHWLSDLKAAEDFSDPKANYRVQLALTNIGDGLLVPLFGPYHKRGYIFIGFHKPREFYDEVFLWQIQGALQSVHVKYCMLVETLRKHIELTKREGEVLELITFGKTNPEIGIILGISASTVAGHVKRIFLKFDARDRVTVALRARVFNL